VNNSQLDPEVQLESSALAAGCARDSTSRSPEPTKAAERTDPDEDQATSKPTTDVKPEDLLALWRLHRGSLPHVREFSQERRRKCRARLSAHAGDVEKFVSDWGQAVRKAAQTAFLRGDGPRGVAC
jgi:hypothetical protein